MARPEVNRSGEMQVFACVVDTGGFSLAARAQGMTPSAVSKLISRLEARLGAKLFDRTTRRLRLTPEGQTFYERSVRLLSDIDEAELCAAGGDAPSGRLSVHTSAAVSMHVILPLIAGFLFRNPRVTVDVLVSDEFAGTEDRRPDVIVSSTPIQGSCLFKRVLCKAKMVIVASPSYLQRCGEPKVAEELSSHNLVGSTQNSESEGWPLIADKGMVRIPIIGNVRASDNESLRILTIDGVGVSRLPYFVVGDDIKAGRLVEILADCNPGDQEEIHAACPSQDGHVPIRARAFLDFLRDALRVQFGTGSPSEF